MKPVLLLAVIAGSVVFAGCETTVVEHRSSRPAYVERDVRYRSYPRRDTVVIRDYDRRAYRGDSRYYRSGSNVRYYNDGPRRYYLREGRRVYVNVDI